MKKKIVSILVPCFNEEESLPVLYQEVKKIMDAEVQYEWELFLVDDGSKDNTLAIILDLAREDSRISYISLSRNFGKENAMLAGFDHVCGDCVVVMDADMQHPPVLVPEMLHIWSQGYEDVYGKRINRGKESKTRKLLSLLFYKLLSFSTRFDILPNAGDFRLLDRKCIDALRRLREKERYTKGMYCWIGFKKAKIEYYTQERVGGTSKWNLYSLFNLAIEGIISFTTAPLRIASFIGFFIAIVAMGYMLWVILKAILFGEPVAGFPTMVSVLLFLGSVQLVAIGILGEYVGRIFNESKNRPVYIVSRKKTKVQ